MRCEIIGVGTVLLSSVRSSTPTPPGSASALADVGWDCSRHTVVGDNELRIAEAVREALGRADAVILTGGLGPTQDDVTREALAAGPGWRWSASPSWRRGCASGSAAWVSSGWPR